MTDDDLWNQFQRAKRTSQELLARGSGESEHTTWMNECVPQLMDYGKSQLESIAACLNIWRDQWERDHPDGRDDPGPSPPGTDSTREEEKRLLRLRLSQRLRDGWGG
jgi:hypothetical protein